MIMNSVKDIKGGIIKKTVAALRLLYKQKSAIAHKDFVMK